MPAKAGIHDLHTAKSPKPSPMNPPLPPPRYSRESGNLLAKTRLTLLAASLILAIIFTADRLFPPNLTRLHSLSLAAAASNGTILDVLTSPDGFYRLPATTANVDPKFLKLLLATEDKRFFSHPGIDPLAMSRAVFQLITRFHVASGGSTLTMQVARLLTPHPHNIEGKLQDMARALQLEAHFSKQQILAMYLTLAPYGGNIEGIRAASLIYFQQDPAHLTPAEAALLVALPRSPECLRPDRRTAAALAATRRVLARAGLSPNFPATDLAPLARHKFPQSAPHLAERLRSQGLSGIVTTTLDATLQTKTAALAARALPFLAPSANIAALMVNNREKKIIAYLGGANFFAPQGMVDMVRATRSPGSTLKPFIYGMALDNALVTPDTLIEDAPLNIAGYAPADFDKSFHGMVTVREALQQSYNLPAILLLRALGPARFAATLNNAGTGLRLPGGAPSLPIALGGVGISLQNLAMLYTALANAGAAAPLHFLAVPPSPTTPVMSPNAAAQIGAILRGSPLPDGVAPGRPIAYKTGTSYGFRDAWAAGFSPDYTVIVWTGRTDGTPTPGAYGRLTAAPILFQLFALLPPDMSSPPPAPAEDAPGLQVFNAPRTPPAFIQRRPQITFPPNGAILQVTDSDGTTTPISLEAQGGTPPYRWVINGEILPQAPTGMSMSWQPPGPGFAHIAVIDKNESATSEDISLH
jgi:penicillin-binding protein 1C